MRFRTAIIGFIGLASLAACSGYTATGPYGGGTGGGQGGTGGGGGGPVGAVTLGPGIQFVSSHNGTENPAVDTIAVGGSVSWTWTGSLPHSVQSIGTSRFSSSSIKTGSGTYAVTFTVPGTYQYDCAVHGTAMRGTIVVQ
jgi:copper binding plastocyanin/azurin family protein